MENTSKKYITVKLLTWWALALCITNCQSQTKPATQEIKKLNAMEIFDIANFKKNNVDGVYEFTLNDSTEVQQFENKTSYTQKTEHPSSFYSTYKEFDKTSGVLIKSGQEFHHFPIGMWIEYDIYGRVLKEDDLDKPFKFTIKDLAAKMIQEKKDIYDVKSQVTISRGTNPEPYYIVSFPLNSDSWNEQRILVIDGTTGKTIKEEITISEG